MRLHRILRLLTLAPLGAGLGAALAGCADLDQTNPNGPSTATFWASPEDALRGTNAVYAGLLTHGTFGRWQGFNFDIRSDIGTARISPWGDLANYNRFILNNYNFEISVETWQDSYRGISRANQVIANVPNIEFASGQTALRDRYVGEAKFVRALLYFNLVNLYGGNIPLITAPQALADRPGSSTVDAVYAQIEQDLTDAAAVLPDAYGGQDRGRATKGAALAMLGKAHLQQREWDLASDALQQVVELGRYTLLPNYADNFIATNDETNSETVFDVQSGDPTTISENIAGLEVPRMVGPCHPNFGVTFCDGRPTRWYYQQFLQEQTTTGGTDPRLDATIFYNKPGSTETAYGRPLADLFTDVANTPIREDTLIFFKKYMEYYIPAGFQRWENPINYKVIRYADVLLMLAEALNEQGQTPAAANLVNQVRSRVGLANVAAPDQATLRDRILHERLLEFGLEGQRWFDLARHDLFDPAVLATHDDDFATFQVNRSELLPIPVSEINLNPNIDQNLNW
jgi:tetratricopeptide (TPR) repeat protein